jgi:beta-lactamase regulating signal transducer with metallopeptidase domain
MSTEFPTVVELAVRVSLVFVVGIICAMAVHRQAASLRHLVWSATVTGSLVLAVLVPWAPRMEIPLRGWKVVRQPGAPVVAPSASAVTEEPVHRIEEVGERIAGASTTLRIATGNGGVPLWLVIWLTGGAVVIGWGIVGRLGLAYLARRARPVTGGPWRASIDEAAGRMGVRRPIEILVSDHVGAPVTWGIRRPVLVVPAESIAWNDDIRRSVAAHEVAHIARHDYLHQLFALAACSVYWFHPLTWALVRQMRLMAERACDDLVLAQGTSGEDYAAHLIGVARGSRALRLAGAVAIGMARPSTLEGRIMAVLDPTKRRGEPSRMARRTAGVAAVVTMVLLGAVRPVPADARAGFETSLPGIVVVPRIESRTSRPMSNTVQVSQEGRAGRSQDMEEVFPATPGDELELDLDAGGSVTVRGWDDNRVQVRTHLDGEDWRDVEVTVDRQSRGILVRARPIRSRNNQRFDNRFEIRVPRRYDVRIRSAGGSLTLIDVHGRFTGHTGGGSLVMDGLNGSTSLTTGGGEIRVTDSNLSGRVTTGGGTVMLSRVSGGLRGSSGSGPVIYGESGSASGSRARSGSGSNETSDLSSVNVTGGGSRIDIGRNATYRSGTLNIDKAGGDIELNAAPNGARVHTGGGDIRVGEAGGDVSAHTGGGDVRVGPAAASVEAGTGAGEVHIIVDRSARDQVIEAWSGKGRVIIELPRDFEGRLELETAHTRTHEETSRIRSDFEIDREPLTEWDDREGTARRYLRASGRIGRGNARVIVRTVNGEIEIRRRER